MSQYCSCGKVEIFYFWLSLQNIFCKSVVCQQRRWLVIFCAKKERMPDHEISQFLNVSICSKHSLYFVNPACVGGGGWWMVDSLSNPNFCIFDAGPKCEKDLRWISFKAYPVKITIFWNNRNLDIEILINISDGR